MKSSNVSLRFFHPETVKYLHVTQVLGLWLLWFLLTSGRTGVEVRGSLAGPWPSQEQKIPAHHRNPEPGHKSSAGTSCFENL